MKGTVRVDLGNGSATITGDDGSWQGTWSNVTGRGVPVALAGSGWRLIGKLRISPADNGYIGRVEKL